jgi:hypothetical protein
MYAHLNIAVLERAQFQVPGSDIGQMLRLGKDVSECIRIDEIVCVDTLERRRVTFLKGLIPFFFDSKYLAPEIFDGFRIFSGILLRFDESRNGRRQKGEPEKRSYHIVAPSSEFARGSSSSNRRSNTLSHHENPKHSRQIRRFSHRNRPPELDFSLEGSLETSTLLQRKNACNPDD